MYRASLLLLAVCVIAFHPGMAAAQEKKVEPIDEPILGKTVGDWIKILRTDQNPKYRRAALIALEASNTARTLGLPALLNTIENDKEPQVRQEAVMLLGRLDPNTRGALKALVEALQTDKADQVREAAATAIGNKFQKQAVDYVSVLAMSLKDPHTGTRIAVAGALRNMEDNAKPAIPALFEAAKNPKEDAQVRAAALHVVSRYAKDDARTVPLLLDILKSKDNSAALREAAADGLARSGTESSEVVTALCQTLGDKNLELRKASAVALGRMGAKAKSGWPTIKERLSEKKEDSSIRNHLIRLTGTIGKTNAEAIKVLTTAAVEDKSTENRLAAIQELAELGPLAKAAMPELTEIASQDPRASIREAANKAVKKISEK